MAWCHLYGEKFIFCSFSTKYLLFCLMQGDIFTVYLDYDRIQGIPTRTCSICEQLPEIQCSNFKSKEQTSVRLSCRQVIRMIVSPEDGRYGFHTIPEFCKVLSFLSLCMTLGLCTVDRWGRYQNRAHLFPDLCYAPVLVRALVATVCRKGSPHLTIFVWSAAGDWFHACRTLDNGSFILV